jgi:hypothetical protein
LKSLRTADVQLEAGPNAAIGVVAQVPELLKHPRTLSALVEYLGTIAPIFEHKQVSSSQLERASRTLAQSFAHDADIGITGVVGTDVTGKFELLMGDAITFGLDAEIEAETGILVGALYRNGPDGLALSQTCYADHHE